MGRSKKRKYGYKWSFLEKNKAKLKPKFHDISFTATPDENGVVKFNFDKNGNVNCPTAIETATYAYEGYFKNSGKIKVVNQVPITSKVANTDQYSNIKENFDILIGIDTNDYLLKGQKVAISSIIYSITPLSNKEVKFAKERSFIILEPKKGLNSELIGWYLLFNSCLNVIDPSNEKRLILFTDSELGNHDEYNNRTKEYLSKNVLPDNITLGYASSDVGNDLPNKVLKACDKLSREVFELLRNETLLIPENYIRNTSLYFESYLTMTFK
ncbi:MAG: hypothetical protein RIC80_02230 [Cyclobacteriaceae bacterium]